MEDDDQQGDDLEAHQTLVKRQRRGKKKGDLPWTRHKDGSKKNYECNCCGQRFSRAMLRKHVDAKDNYLSSYPTASEAQACAQAMLVNVDGRGKTKKTGATGGEHDEDDDEDEDMPEQQQSDDEHGEEEEEAVDDQVPIIAPPAPAVPLPFDLDDDEPPPALPPPDAEGANEPFDEVLYQLQEEGAHHENEEEEGPLDMLDRPRNEEEEGEEEEEEGEEAVNKRPAAGFVLPAAKKHKTVAKTTTLKAMKDMLENGTDQATLWRMLVAEHGNDHGALPTQVESYYHKACKAVYGE